MSNDLLKLIEAVEAGDNSPNWMAIAGYSDAKWGYCERALNGSVNAAITLLEALLPGWEWGRMNNRMFVERGGSVVSSRGSNPARALLLAVLRAKLMEASHE